MRSLRQLEDETRIIGDDNVDDADCCYLVEVTIATLTINPGINEIMQEILDKEVFLLLKQASCLAVSTNCYQAVWLAGEVSIVRESKNNVAAKDWVERH